MQKKAVVVRESMRSFVGDCQYHEPLFPSSVANIAVARLLLLGIACPSIPASMTSIVQSLAASMHPDLALREVNNGV